MGAIADSNLPSQWYSTSAQTDTFATGAQEVVQLSPVSSQQGPDLLLFGQNLLVLDAQPGRALCRHSQLVSLLHFDQQGT